MQAYVEERAGEQGEDDKWRTQMAKQLARMQKAQDEQLARLARAQDEQQARLAKKQDEAQAALKAQAATLAAIMDKLGTPNRTVEEVAARDPIATDQARGTRATAERLQPAGPGARHEPASKVQPAAQVPALSSPRALVKEKSGWLYKRSNVRGRARIADFRDSHAVRLSRPLPCMSAGR